MIYLVMLPSRKTSQAVGRFVDKHPSKNATALWALAIATNSYGSAPNLENTRQQTEYAALVAQAPKEPPQWTSQHQPSAAELNALEQQAKRAEDINVLAAYQTAYLARNYPELLSNTGPRFVIGSAADPTFLPRAAVMAGNAENISGIQSALERINRREFTGAYSKKSQSIALSPFLCPDCINPGIPENEDCSLPSHPATVRLHQITSIFASTHEAGHMLSTWLGIHAGFEKVGDNDWADHAEENFANTYGALRTVRLLGMEGAYFLPTIKGMVSLTAQSSAVDAIHHSSRSIQSVMDYMKFDKAGNPTAKTAIIADKLAHMEDRDILKLAQQLSRPVSPFVYSNYLLPLGDAYNNADSPEDLKQMQDELTTAWKKRPDRDHTLYEIRDAWSPKLNQPSYEQVMAWTKLNPYLPEGLAKDYYKFSYADPQQAKAMFAFALERRPAACTTALATQISQHSEGRVSIDALLAGQSTLIQPIASSTEPTHMPVQTEQRPIQVNKPKF